MQPSFAVLALLAASLLPAQATVFQVTTNSPAALQAAITAANALAFQTSAAQPVVIEFTGNLIGQTFQLTQALPVLLVDHVIVRVAGAAPGSRVILDATNAPTAFRLASRDARIQNLRFQNAGGPGSQADVFTAFGTDQVTFANCDFDNATGNALWLVGSTFTTVQDCNFRFGSSGFVATGGSSDVTLLRCTFSSVQQAAMLSAAHRVQFTDCVFDANGVALALQPVCADVTFGPGNTVRNTTTLPALVASGAVRLRVTGSLFHDNHTIAVQLNNLCADAVIADTVCTRNAVATGAPQIVVDGSTLVRIQRCEATDGGTGIFAGTTSSLFVEGTAAAPVRVLGNDREGLTLFDCTDVTVSQLRASNNLQALAGAQLQLVGCARVDVTASDVSTSSGAGRIGMRIDACDDVRVGLGTSVLDNGARGILVTNSTDVLLGAWGGAGGGLTVRGTAPVHFADSARVRVVGSAAFPCAITNGTAPSSAALTILRCDDGAFGPFLAVDGAHAATTGIQVSDSDRCVLDGADVHGHVTWGITAFASADARIHDCFVDGAVGGAPATGEGIRLDPGSHRAELLGNVVARQQGGGFLVVESDDVQVGPANRAIDNGGDAFVARDSGTGAPTRNVSFRSCAAVGRNLATQSGFRCIRVRARLTNVTATRQGVGVNLEAGAVATLVNAISWGNGVDRRRDGPSSGSWFHGMRATSSGTSSPGTWTEQNMLLNVNPQFVSAATGDVRLLAGSPAIDSGLHATPLGSPLPPVDALLGQRVFGGVVDRGACEFMPAAGTGNRLDVAGTWLRSFAQNQLAFTVRGYTAQSGQPFLLLVSGTGTGPAVPVSGGTAVPIVPDVFTSILLSAPAWSTGTIDGTGTGAVAIPIPPAVVPALPELTFVAVVTTSPTPTNPVIVRYLP